jgi:nitroreductase/NAD-dependent dihydropyrimidine dehydrogenase PreA subunit
MDIVSIDRERCTLCGLCASVCVRRLIELGDEAATVTDPGKCVLCGHCKAVCPEDAFRLPSLSDREFSSAPAREDIPDPDRLMVFFRSRRSTRLYQKRAVDRDKVLRILDAGRFAPNGGNRQALQYLVLQSEGNVTKVRQMALLALGEIARRIQEALREKRTRGEALSVEDMSLEADGEWLLDMPEFLRQGTDLLFYFAPVVILCHGDPLSRTIEVDAGLAGMQMALMAEALGLGTCFCHALVLAIRESGALRRTLKIPEDRKAVLSFMLGHADVTYPRLVARNPVMAEWL